MQAILYYISLPFIYLLSLLPFSILHILSDFVSFLLYKVIKYRQKVIRENLKNCFPEKSEQERIEIEKQFYSIVADYMIESLKGFSISKKTVLRIGRIKNPEIFQKYLQNNQNIIITTGHVGSQEMLNSYVGASDDFPLTPKVVYRRLNNPYFDRIFKKNRQKYGSKLYPTEEAYHAISQQDDSRPFAFILLNDQAATPTKAYWTQFLHQETCFFTGPELYAREYNLPVLYGFITRPKRGHFEIQFILITDKPNEEVPNFISETHANLLEKNILSNPPIWFWSHKRWKHKRDGSLSVYDAPN